MHADLRAPERGLFTALVAAAERSSAVGGGHLERPNGELRTEAERDEAEETRDMRRASGSLS